MVNCVVPVCKEYTGKRINKEKCVKVTFHKFPLDPVRRQEWADHIGVNVGALKVYSRICSSHFPEEMIDRTSLSCVRLRDNAVPCINTSQAQTSKLNPCTLERMDQREEMNSSECAIKLEIEDNADPYLNSSQAETSTLNLYTDEKMDTRKETNSPVASIKLEENTNPVNPSSGSGNVLKEEVVLETVWMDDWESHAETPERKTRKEDMKKKYVKLSIKEKCRLVQDVEEGMRKVHAAKKYNIDQSSVTYILKNKHNYLNAKDKICLRKRSRLDKGQHPLIEFALVDWIRQKRKQGITITGPLIREKALLINEELLKMEKNTYEKKTNQKETESTESEEENNEGKEKSFELNVHEKKFKASDGWLSNFKARHGIRETGEKLSADLETCKNLADKEIVENAFNAENEKSKFDECQSAIENVESSATVQLTEKKKRNPKKAYENFLYFREWFEENNQCSKDDIEKLNQMQDFVEKKLNQFMTTASVL